MKDSTLTLRNGLIIPRMAIGTWTLENGKAKEAVKKALANGIRYIDTAQEYLNENEVANAIREYNKDRKKIIVSTKLTPREVIDYETAKEGINKSAIIFSGIGIDIMFIHAENHWDKAGKKTKYDNIGIVKALLEAKRDGIIKAYGVSNFSAEELQKIKDSGLELPEIVQLPHSIGTRRQDVINFCVENNIQMQSYSPFKSSSAVFEEDDIVKEIANSHGKSIAEVYLSYAMQTTGCVVFRSLNEDHIKSNLNLIPFLTEKDINILNKIKRENLLWRFEGFDSIIADDIRPDSEIVDYIIDNETLLGVQKVKNSSKVSDKDSKLNEQNNTSNFEEQKENKDFEIVEKTNTKPNVSDYTIDKKTVKTSIIETEKKSKSKISISKSNVTNEKKDYEIVNDVSLENIKSLEISEEEIKKSELKEKDDAAYKNMKKLRTSNKKEIENLINSVNRINIYNINYVRQPQSYSTTRNNLADNLRLRIASTINNQVKTLLRLDDAERYYFYKLIIEDPLTGSYSKLEKKLYENYFIKNPFVETLIKSYEESIKEIKIIQDEQLEDKKSDLGEDEIEKTKPIVLKTFKDSDVPSETISSDLEEKKEKGL